LPAGAEAFKPDIPGAAARFSTRAILRLRTHTHEIAAAIRAFLGRAE
jgi:hypothetical protein